MTIDLAVIEAVHGPLSNRDAALCGQLLHLLAEAIEDEARTIGPDELRELAHQLLLHPTSEGTSVHLGAPEPAGADLWPTFPLRSVTRAGQKLRTIPCSAGWCVVLYSPSGGLLAQMLYPDDGELGSALLGLGFSVVEAADMMRLSRQAWPSAGRIGGQPAERSVQ